MGDTERRAALPWWVEAGLRFLREFGFPAAVAAYVLVSHGAKLDRQGEILQRIVTVLEERLPRAGR